MDLDISNDWTVLDWQEPCTLRSVANTGFVEQFLPAVLKQSVTTREVATSMGAYRANDVAWDIPTVLLSPGFRPEPGDTITDRDGNVYTVLEAIGQERDGGGYRNWRCISRNLVIAYKLRDLITIQAPLAGLDDGATELKTWVTRYAKLAAKVTLLSNEIEEARGIRGAVATYAVYLAQEVDVVPSRDRVVWPGALGGYLDITGYRSRSSIADLSVLDCRQMV